MMKCESMTNSYAKYIQFSARSMPGIELGSGKCFLFRGRWTIISCDLELSSFKLLAVAQSDMCWMSDGMDGELEDGTKR